MKEQSSNQRANDRVFFPDDFPNEAVTASAPAKAIQSVRSRRSRHSLGNKYGDTEDVSNGLTDERRASKKTCTCPLDSQHVGKELLHTVVALPIDAVFTLLFVQEQFMIDVYNAKKTVDVTATSWEERDDGIKYRQMTYTMPLSSNLGPKVTHVTENQILQPQSVPGDVYVVECEVMNSGIPYSDTFSIIKHICITRQADGKTSVVSWVSIKYKKTAWGFVKNMIEKNTYSGVEVIFQEIISQLQAEAERINNPSVGRKRRRAATSTASTKPSSQGQPHDTNKTTAKTVSESSHGASCCLGVTMAVALVTLVVFNAFVYKKLFFLEEMVILDNPKMNNPSVRYLGNEVSWEAVANVLHRQQEIHDGELEQWKTKILQASQTLEETQGALLWIMDKLHQHGEESMRVVQEHSDQIRDQWIQAEVWKQRQHDSIAQMHFTPQRHDAQHDAQHDERHERQHNAATFNDDEQGENAQR